jgi:hypothetical protein
MILHLDVKQIPVVTLRYMAITSITPPCAITIVGHFLVALLTTIVKWAGSVVEVIWLDVEYCGSYCYPVRLLCSAYLYLALQGIYLAVKAAFPNNPTL